MLLKFTKMHGIKNDYIYFNCFEQKIDDPKKLAVNFSFRNSGIGADGIVLICPSEVADAKMRMFNADGSEGKMCGNAIRCVGKYLYDEGICKKDIIKVETLSGIKTLQIILKDDVVSKVCVDMGKAEFESEKIPVNVNLEKVIGYKKVIGKKEYELNCVSMGNPHCVVFCDDVEKIDIEKTGLLFENNKIFPERVNTEFVKVIDKNTLQMRVWERGSGETLACGTGACASVVIACEKGFCDKNTDVKVILKGGELVIRYNDDGKVFMTGSATKVFDGIIDSEYKGE